MEQLTLTVQDKQFPCLFPSVGHLLDIYALQQACTNGRYDMMAMSQLAMPQALLDVVDAFSHFKILCPTLLTAVGVDKITDLDPQAGRDLGKIYNEQFFPWFTEISEKLFGTPKTEQKPDGGK